MGNSYSFSPPKEKPKVLPQDRIHAANYAETKKIGFLTPEKIALIESNLLNGKLEETVSIINKMIEDIDNAGLNIAVTGQAGVGKSTFINALRGVEHEDEDAARTGVVETTTDITSYEHPKLPEVKLWDLPGMGTPNFPPETYLKQVNFNIYDFFIIISSSRFLDNDVKLARKIRQIGKKFYFVRTKVDLDLYNERKTKGQNFKEENVLQVILENCLQHLQKAEFQKPQVFLISSLELGSFDFPKLTENLAKELPEHKRYVFFLSLPNISHHIIDQKKANLQSRIWLEAAKSGLSAIRPIIGVIEEDDIKKLKEHLTNYQKQFGVDDVSLLKISEASKKPLEELMVLIKSPHLLTIKKDENIWEKLWRYAEIGLALPGGILASALYFRKSYYIHRCFLETVADDAKILLSKLWETSV